MPTKGTIEALDDYLATIQKKAVRGRATEHTYRSALERLLQTAGDGIDADNDPKRIACGAPDFLISRHDVPLGHVETKDIGVDLDEIERSKGRDGAQFARYLAALPNWVLTDYLEFRWFVAGRKRLTARIAELDPRKRIRPVPNGPTRVGQLLEAFFTQPAATVRTAKELAERLAGMTRNIRDLITATFEHGGPAERRWIENWLTAFRDVLIPDLDERHFADMFAQTLAYGLFAAKIHLGGDGGTFTREKAAYALPKTNPFLRKLFAEFGGPDMPETFDWAVDDTVSLLMHAAIDEIVKDIGHGGVRSDPVVHFYETFLQAYDPQMRELRGVYYTPEPVVGYIVRSIDHLLKTHFKRPAGLADEQTLILDPATGTGTFLYVVLQRIHERFRGQQGTWDSYVESHLLNRMFGFELLMAPYAVAHLKLGVALHETGYQFAANERLGIYLTNTLEEAVKRSQTLFARWVADEANAAAEIKRDRPIMIILGNPPYSGHAANRSRNADGTLTFIGRLIEDYRMVDGGPLGERNPKWLQDDYVKFIRFAQWRIARTGYGVLGFITNHGYLDNPTFRGMRQNLMQSFDDIFVYNLHGNLKKQEHAPGGGVDENVFDIQQGVAIILAIREAGQRRMARVHHCDLWGLREKKYDVLTRYDVSTTRWRQLAPSSPTYLFVPQDDNRRAEYELGWKVTEILPLWSLGLLTKRDGLAVAFDKKELLQRLKDFADPNVDDNQTSRRFNLPIKDKDKWVLHRAKQRLQKSLSEREVRRVLYRPFDSRVYYDDDEIVARRNTKVLGHFEHDNIGLIVGRQGGATGSDVWDVVWCTRGAVDQNLFRRGGATVLPLYLYPAHPERGLGQSALDIETAFGPGGRRPSLAPKFIAAFEQQLKLPFRPDGKAEPRATLKPEDLFHYIYAVLHSPTYRTRYAEFLKSDFPRVPLTSSRRLFARLVGIGSELAEAHLLDSPRPKRADTTFPQKGSNRVERVVYEDGTERVWINDSQYIEGVPDEIWRTRIGGHQVCEKWLKDRVDRVLTWDDLQHYQKMVIALRETKELMATIDRTIDAHGGWPLK